MASLGETIQHIRRVSLRYGEIVVTDFNGVRIGSNMTDEEIYNAVIAHQVERALTLNEYQKLAMTTCMESCENFSYMFINLVGEVGEFASKVAKAIRKREMVVTDGDIWPDYDHNLCVSGGIEALDTINPELRPGLRKEAGDILWQLSGLCKVMGWDLEDVARENLDKLQSRQKRHCIDGEGDNR